MIYLGDCIAVDDKQSDSPMVFSVGSNPFGISYAEWTAKWWKWALSIPLENNPIRDDTSKYYRLNQSGPVWFLAGTSGGIVERKCTIPKEKAILFPILNYGATFADEPTIKSEPELISLAKREIDVVSDLEVVVDGTKLDDLKTYRVRSPIFNVVLPENNFFAGRPGPTRGVSDGYWLFLKPLQVGEHNLNSFGSCKAGRVSIGVNYQLTIR
jgi:hypothetical protein